MMEYLIFPMRTVALTQREYDSRPTFSHHGINAIDISGKDGTIEDCCAPCTMKVLAINSGSAHTIFFGSCDSKGNPAKVRLADGSIQQITIAMTHKDSVKEFSVGQIIKSGEYCYSEGTYANGKKGACGVHCHIEIAKGWQTTKKWHTYDGKRYFKFDDDLALMPTKCFFLLKDFNTIRKGTNSYGTSYGMDLPWLWVSVRKSEGDFDMKLKMKTTKGGQYIRETISFDKYGKPNGKKLATIPKGNTECIITGFVDGLQKDGYQWVSVDWNGVTGFCQWDSMWFEVYEY